MRGRKLRGRFASTAAEAREASERSFDDGATELRLRVTDWQGSTWTCAVESCAINVRIKPTSTQPLRGKPFVALEGGNVAAVRYVGWDDAASEAFLVLEILRSEAMA